MDSEINNNFFNPEIKDLDTTPFVRNEIISLLNEATYVNKGELLKFRPEIGAHSNKVLLTEYLPDDTSEKNIKSSNSLKFLTLYYNDRPHLAIFKPQNGESERMLADFNIGAMYPREVAAERVSHLGNMNIVPPTVFKKIDGEIGSLQLYIPPQMADIPKLIPSFQWSNIYNSLTFRKMAILDRLIHNCDRNEKNILVSTNNNGDCFAIDHGASFCTPKKNDAVMTIKYYESNRELAMLKPEEKSMLTEMLTKEQEFYSQMASESLDFLFEAQAENIFDTIRQMLANESLYIPYKYLEKY